MNPFLCEPSELSSLHRPVVAIGNFDGIHLGHQTIFNTLRTYAEERNVSAIALTFEPHPIEFFKPNGPHFRLQTLSEKKRTAKNFLDALIAVDFRVIASWSPTDFFEKILLEQLSPSCIMVGNNFFFGRNRSGNVDTLRELCQHHHVELMIIDDVSFEQDDELISSTRVRGALARGDLSNVTKLLGRPWELEGTIVHGDAIGKTMGFPTANIQTASDRLLPPVGIYATYFIVDAVAYQASSYIGTRPTFDGQELRIESFVLDAPTPFMIYDKSVRLQFIQYLRGDISFDTPHELVHQMEIDVQQTRHALHHYRGDSSLVDNETIE